MDHHEPGRSDQAGQGSALADAAIRGRADHGDPRCVQPLFAQRNLRKSESNAHEGTDAADAVFRSPHWRRAHLHCRDWFWDRFMSFGVDVRGGNCRTVSRRGRPFIAISGTFSVMERGSAFMTICGQGCAARPAKNLRPASASSTVTPSRRRKKGGPRVRRGQEDQGPQATSDRRHAGPDRGLGGPSGQRSRPGWSTAPHSATGNSMATTAIDLCRWRLRRQVCRLDPWLVRALRGDRETAVWERLRRTSQTLDRGANVCMAREISPTVERLRDTDAE